MSSSLVLHFGACERYDQTSGNTTFQQPNDMPDDPAIQSPDATVGMGVGGACVETVECRIGLVCVETECRAIANAPGLGTCILTDECAEELYCSSNGSCRLSGAGGAGAPCSDAGECLRGLYCRAMGMIGTCVTAGEGDLFTECETTSDCSAGLVCGENGECSASSPRYGFVPWPGVACAGADGGPPRPFFDLSDTSGEFFRLPYPSDVRLSAGTVDLSAFSSLGPGLAGFDPVARVSDAAARVQQGFSLTPIIYFRFSSGMDFQSISGAANGTVTEPTLHFVNVDPDSSQYGQGPSYNWHVTDGAGSKAICSRWLAARVSWEQPLKPGTTYAVYMTKGVRAANGTEMVADDDFAHMLQDAAPAGDERVAEAWQIFEPLRTFLDDKGLSRDDVIGGTVFTTQRPHDTMADLRGALEAPATPTPSAMTLCAEGAESPCTTSDVACTPLEGSEADVLHLTLEIPRVQQGVRPFLDAGDGGGLTVTDAGPQLHGSDTVCASLTVPRGEMPESGWPVLLYLHEGGGNFASAIPAAAQLMAEVGVAVLSWDGPMQGERGQAGVWSEALVYNLRNPIAALGNLYQGAADVFTMVRAVGAWDVSATDSPTGNAIRLDASRVALLGHGLGASIGGIAAPYEPGVGLTVWSSAAAGVSEIMTVRTLPVDVPYALALVLQEFGDAGVSAPDSRHPILSLYQGLLGPVDSLTHLAGQASPLGSEVPQHVMQIQGVGDWYAPSKVTDIVARLVDAELVSPVLREISGVESIAPPVTNNMGTEQTPRTSVVVQVLPPTAENGEPSWPAGDAWLQDSGVRAQVQAFVSSWIDNGVPTLPERSEL